MNKCKLILEYGNLWKIHLDMYHMKYWFQWFQTFLTESFLKSNVFAKVCDVAIQFMFQFMPILAIYSPIVFEVADKLTLELQFWTMLIKLEKLELNKKYEMDTGN